MEYSVGSLADHISGTNTPNKVKVTLKNEKLAKSSSKYTDYNTSTKEKKIGNKSFSNTKLPATKRTKTKNAATVSNPKTGISENSKKVKFNKFSKRKNNTQDVDDHASKKLKTSPDLKSNMKAKKVESFKNSRNKLTKKSKLKNSFMPALVTATDDLNEILENSENTEHNVQGEMDTSEGPVSSNYIPSTTALNAIHRLNKKRNKLGVKIHIPDDPEKSARTIFVGNVPLSTTKIELCKYFSMYGPVESARLRCPPVADLRVSKKVSYIKGEYHKDRTSMICYVVFKSADSIKKALKANGTLFKTHHLRIDKICSTSSESEHDKKKSVFVGNIPLAVQDEELWNLFSDCGEIDSVRVIRDNTTGLGRGFGYVNFNSSDSVELALNLDGTTLQKRIIRVSRDMKPHTDKKKVGESSSKRDEFGNKKRKNNRDHVKNVVDEPLNQKVEVLNAFKGTIGEKRKKKKTNKSDLLKKKLMKKLVPRTKPPLEEALEV